MICNVSGGKAFELQVEKANKEMDHCATQAIELKSMIQNLTKQMASEFAYIRKVKEIEGNR